MKYKLENDVLTIYLEGELNSYNSEEAEKELEDILKTNSFKSIVLDLENLNYISSAGLRIIVRLKQQHDDTSLVKVPKGVFDIIEMVGLQNIINIEKL